MYPWLFTKNPVPVNTAASAAIDERTPPPATIIG
jgi:hypothetical protein